MRRMTPLIYARPDKLSHTDTILYEIDMLRFATGRLVEGKAKGWKDPRDAWVYLEAFLLHYRNLIEFLGKNNPSDTDLNVITIWKLEKLPAPSNLKQIHTKGMELLDEYEPPNSKGGGRISQYLQHCTTKRIEFKDWRIDTMTSQIEPLLTEVEKHLRPGNAVLLRVPAVTVQDVFSASTATATITPNILFDRDAYGKKRTPI
jgi:hypothetical protein